MLAVAPPPPLLLPLPRGGEVLRGGQRGHEHPLGDGRGGNAGAGGDGDAVVGRREEGVVEEVVDAGGEEVQPFQLRDRGRGGREHAERDPDLGGGVVSGEAGARGGAVLRGA